MLSKFFKNIFCVLDTFLLPQQCFLVYEGLCKDELPLHTEKEPSQNQTFGSEHGEDSEEKSDKIAENQQDGGESHAPSSTTDHAYLYVLYTGTYLGTFKAWRLFSKVLKSTLH